MSADSPRWPVWKLAAVLYPFAAGAVAINLFLLSLMAPAVGLAPLAPITAVKWSIGLGIPATWAAGRWIRSLMDEADGQT